MNAGQEPGKLKLTYLGQAGFIADCDGVRIVIDPYLSNYVVDGGIGSAELFSRAFPPPVHAGEVTGVKWIFLTHDHADHCDPQTVLPMHLANPAARIVCPRPVADHLQKIGIPVDLLVVPEILKLQKIGTFEFYAVPAAHYGFDKDPVTGEYAYFSFAIKLGRKWLIHSGDTIDYPEYAANLLKFTPMVDIACLPVNGRDVKREAMGIVGNMNSVEAFSLATKVNTKVLIPIHNDLFTFNSEDPAVLNGLAARRKKKMQIRWLAAGNEIEL
jgi:L-ascorbate metabolism protein UlaG (beta-lactamase superfamily)